MTMMTTNSWNGVCVCGKREADGIKCRFGASHRPLIKRRERLVPEPRRTRERLPEPRKRERLDLFDE